MCANIKVKIGLTVHHRTVRFLQQKETYYSNELGLSGFLIMHAIPIFLLLWKTGMKIQCLATLDITN